MATKYVAFTCFFRSLLEGPPLPPNVRRAPAEPWRVSTTRMPRGLEGPPHTPERSPRPGGAVARLDNADAAGPPRAQVSTFAQTRSGGGHRLQVRLLEAFGDSFRIVPRVGAS
jgi:hypothetical protein